MKELYRRWNPIDHSRKWLSLSCEGLRDDREGLRIVLNGGRSTSADGRRFRVHFDRPLAYRNIDEGNRLMTGGDHADFEEAEGLYRVEHSRWTRWFVEESAQTHAADEITHFAIVTIADWIDVLSKTEPVVTWVEP